MGVSTNIFKIEFLPALCALVYGDDTCTAEICYFHSKINFDLLIAILNLALTPTPSNIPAIHTYRDNEKTAPTTLPLVNGS